MSLPFFHHADLGGLRVGGVVRLDGDEGRHAVVVRRIRPGEQIVLTDGAGTTVAATVSSTGRSDLVATIEDVVHGQPELPRVVVVQAIPKGERGELAVEMLTEVGVDLIVPWNADRSQFRANPERVTKTQTKWQSWAFESSKQSRRSWFCEVAPIASTPEVAKLLTDAALSVVLHEEATTPLASLDLPVAGDVVIVVGPEGGITPSELEAFAATPVRLGDTVLRTSTAGVAAAAALLARSRWS